MNLATTHPADQATIDAAHARYLRALRERDEAAAELSEALEGNHYGLERADERCTDAALDLAEAGETLLAALGYGLPAEPATAEPPAWRWNQHANDAGDRCPHSGDPVPAGTDLESGECPAGCHASHATDDPND